MFMNNLNNGMRDIWILWIITNLFGQIVNLDWLNSSQMQR